MFKVHRSFNLTTGVKNNTIAVVNNEDGITVVYHKTPVFRAWRTGTIELDNGGWDTVSTRHVINRALSESGLPLTYLFRKKGKTYLTHDSMTVEFTGFAKIVAVPAYKSTGRACLHLVK